VAVDVLEVTYAHEGIAVDAHERRAELVLERAQRVLDQVLALHMPHRRVLLLGEEELHVLDRNEPQAVAMPSRDVRAPRTRACRRQLLQLRTGQAPGMQQRGGQLFL